MKNKWSKVSIIILGGAAICLGSVLSGNVHAASFITCNDGSTYDISGKLTPNNGCAILDPLNGAANDSLATVNADAWFGMNDWKFDGKWNSPPPTGGSWTDTSALFNWTGGAQTGTFTYVGPSASIGPVLFIFKDGGSTNLVGYMQNVPASGSYSSPFVEPPFTFPGSGARDVSHISVYYKGDLPLQAIPEPSTVLLFGSGLVGLGLWRWKKKV